MIDAENTRLSPHFFPGWGTALHSLLLGIMVTALFVLNPARSPLQELRHPEASLERLVGREMDLLDALGRAPRWERWIHGVLTDQDPVDEAIGWYEELEDALGSPVAALYRTVLEAEAGGLEVAETPPVSSVSSLRAQRLAVWVGAAYGPEAPPDLETGHRLLAELRERGPPGWFIDVLVRRLATRIGDAGAGAEAESAIRERGTALLWRSRILAAAEVLLLGAAAAALAAIAGRRVSIRIAAAALPPPWTTRDGCGLFVRGAVGFLAVSALTGLLAAPEDMAEVLGAMAAGLPAVLWIVRYQSARGPAVVPTFGLRPEPGSARALVAITLLLIGLSVVGDAGTGLVARALGLRSHWADGFQEDVLYGTFWVVAASAVNAIVWMPIVEELVFRGVVYGTLRRRLPVSLSVALSASAFALLHGYGVIGFAQVLWSGALWALAYERTRSLLPGVLAHAANNFMSTGAFLWLLRA